METKKKEHDYYMSIRKKAEYIFNRYNLLLRIPNLDYSNYYYKKIIYQEIFNEFLLNLFNKEIYGLEFTFTKNEWEFFIDFELDKILKEIIALCRKDIEQYKKMNKNRMCLTTSGF
ncbi:MAG: hypothetical protein E7B11_07800 [Clostridiales bacterium]|nr:hypothetical protein [Clostridiales bacterium]MDU3240459.1 hypothetical protein [Clostridiales bacterium]